MRKETEDNAKYLVNFVFIKAGLKLIAKRYPKLRKAANLEIKKLDLEDKERKIPKPKTGGIKRLGEF